MNEPEKTEATPTLSVALAKQGVANPIRIASRVASFLTEALDDVTASSDSLFRQINPKYVEGSAPTADTDRGRKVNIVLRSLMGLANNTVFKVGMDGFGQHAGGLIVLNVDDDYSHLLAVKGDPYNKGKIGVLGGQGKDEDMGDDFVSALREQGEEIGKFPFDPSRLFYLTTTQEWRTVDSRMEGFWIKASFYVYLATSAEVAAMQEGYKTHVQTTGGDPEIQGLKTFSRRQVLELIRDGKMGYFDQTQAFTLTALCIPELERARKMLDAGGFTEPTPAKVWQQAALIANDDYLRITDRTNDRDWRPELDVDSFFGAA